jgi:hypothetical protein
VLILAYATRQQSDGAFSGMGRLHRELADTRSVPCRSVGVIYVGQTDRSSASNAPSHPTATLRVTVVGVLLGRLPRTSGHGIYGGGGGGVFWTSRCRAVAKTDYDRNGAVLWWMVLCATGQSKAG